MVTAVTEGVRIDVQTIFQDEFSNPMQQHYVFSYRIRIENQSRVTVQLKRRFWQIFDGTGIKREVEGEGVVGQQPVLEPGESYEYVSGCNQTGSVGKMVGFYTMERVVDGKQFKVEVPEFNLIVPYRLN